MNLRPRRNRLAVRPIVCAAAQRRSHRRTKLTAVFALSLLASGCFYYPRTVEYYDADCEIHARRMVLESQVMADTCSGASGHEAAVGCLAMLASVTAGSAAVSGSIVVVGNTVYWFEKRGRRIRRSTFT